MASISASPAVSTDVFGVRVTGGQLPRPRRFVAPGTDNPIVTPSSRDESVSPQAQWSWGDVQLVLGRHLRLITSLAAVFVVSLMAFALMGRVGAAPASAARVASGPVETGGYPAYTVAAGDTLWDIAKATNPQVDPRAVVLQLRVLNNLPADKTLRVGQVLLLPTAS